MYKCNDSMKFFGNYFVQNKTILWILLSHPLVMRLIYARILTLVIAKQIKIVKQPTSHLIGRQNKVIAEV